MTYQVNFLGIGPQRTASSWLHYVLSYHPILCFPKDVKETFFFDERYEKGMDWYWSHFRHFKPGMLCGEIAPTYFDHEAARKRLASHNSNIKIIINIRNPITRAFSLFLHHYGRGQVPSDFYKATKTMPRIIESGHYYLHCPKWEDDFGEDNVLYIMQEDIRDIPEEQMAAIYSFLEIVSVSVPNDGKQRVNQIETPRYLWLAKQATGVANWLRSYRLHGIVEFAKTIGLKRIYRGGENNQPSLTDEIYSDLLSTYEPDIVYLEDRLKRDFAKWRQRY